MPELLERSAMAGRVPAAPARTREARVDTGRSARDDLRRQIAALERQLAGLFSSAFPHQGIEWRVGALGGPRVLGMGELERVRDALAVRVREAQAELERRGRLEQAHRGLLEEMIAQPERHKWERISNEEIGEPGCKHYWSRPRWGLLGMLLGWWRVKLSSGCPLARGRGFRRVPPRAHHLCPAAADLSP